MDVYELNICRIAAVNPGPYYRRWVYVETEADQPVGLYPSSDKATVIANCGYECEEYGLVDDTLHVSRAEFDDGAAIIGGRPANITGRATLRVRYVSPYNFLIAPFKSPINNDGFDEALKSYLDQILQREDVFQEMSEKIARLPKREE